MTILVSQEVGRAIVAETSFQWQDIPAEGLTVDVQVEPEELGLAAEDARVIGPIALSVTMQPAGRHIHAQGHMRASFIDECVRCLKESERRTSIPFSVNYQKNEPMARGRHAHRGTDERAEPEGDAASDDDLYAMSGDRLDLAEMLREHIILSLPMQPLCSERCRGLCPVCGRDRNEHECGCREVQHKNPFSVLENRFKKKD